MSEDDLPPDLTALERELSAAAPPAPPQLRPRVLAAVRQERRRASRSPWRVAAAAAAVLLWANLSMSLTGNFALPSRGAPDAARLETTARRLRDLAPDLPAGEAYRQALLAQSGPGLAPAPAPSSPERVQRRKERRPWDTP